MSHLEATFVNIKTCFQRLKFRIRNSYPMDRMHIILTVPRWLIRLRPEISIAPCPLLPFQVLFMSSCCFHFCLGRPPRSFRPLFLLPLPLINAVLCYAFSVFPDNMPKPPPSSLHYYCGDVSLACPLIQILACDLLGPVYPAYLPQARSVETWQSLAISLSNPPMLCTTQWY